MKKRQWMKIAAVLAAGMLMLAACGKSEPAGNVQESTGSGTEVSGGISGTAGEAEKTTAQETEVPQETAEPEAATPTPDLPQETAQPQAPALEAEHAVPKKIIITNDAFLSHDKYEYVLDDDGDVVEILYTSTYGDSTLTHTDNMQIEYVTDEAGNKVYGEAYPSPERGDAKMLPISLKPLVKTVTRSYDNYSYIYNYTYDDKNRLIEIEWTEYFEIPGYEITARLVSDVSKSFSYEETGETYVVTVRKDYHYSDGDTNDTEIYQEYIFDMNHYFLSDCTYYYGYYDLHDFEIDRTKVISLSTYGSFTRDENGNLLTIARDDDRYDEEYDGYIENGKWTTHAGYYESEMKYLVSREYDGDGNLVSEQYIDETKEFVCNYIYDEHGRLIEIDSNQAGTETPYMKHVLVYDEEGRLITVEAIAIEQEAEDLYFPMRDRGIITEYLDQYIDEYVGANALRYNYITQYSVGDFSFLTSIINESSDYYGTIITFEY